MNAPKKKSEDGKTEFEIVRGKFHIGRGEEHIVKRPGDIVRLTPAQAKNFKDMMKPVIPKSAVIDEDLEDGESVEEKAVSKAG